MVNDYLAPANELVGIVQEIAGKNIYDKFIIGLEKLHEINNQELPVIFCNWLNKAIQKLDELVDEELKIKQLQEHGVTVGRVMQLKCGKQY